MLYARDVRNDAPAADSSSLPQGHGALPRCQAGSGPSAREGQSLPRSWDKGKGILVPVSRPTGTLLLLLLPGAGDGQRPRTSRTRRAGGLPSFNRICRLAI